MLAKTSSALALTAISVCRTMPPERPPRSEISCEERTGFPVTLAGSSSVENIVSSGLVTPTVITTIARAIALVLFRGTFITGESWEMLSRPEKARNEPAKPIRMVTGVSVWFANIFGKSERNWARVRCEKTVARRAMSLRNATPAPMRLTLALALTPNQLRKPSRARIPRVATRAKGSSLGTTTLR